MSDNQRNTTTNESDPETAGDVETAEKDTAAGAAVTDEADEASAEASEAPAEDVADETAAEPTDVAEDRSQAGGTPVSEAKSSVPQGPSAVKASMSSRKAHLTVSRVEPWSVMKFSFVVSLVCFIVLFVAIAVIYATLSMLGVFEELTNMITALLEGDGGEDELGLNPAAWFSPGRVLGYTGVVGALNIVLITALSTVGAMLYNLVADLVGGIDVTLSEAE
ncbi:MULTISPECIES: DUF3566 domain-containing protein [unclassified Nocardiopsis]|uniref:DUF3566 domain-containing protein n=1 Tax=unclassified Nocardiopsis TaxID=2649073 RepID=UPI00135A8CD6|nr:MULTISPECIES: DUF3566 domain-containing protein [unclassified Nocardiopsis]